MKKKPVITLLRGNVPKMNPAGKSSPCWRCNEKMAKTDPVFDISKTVKTRYGYQNNKKRYCQNCMQDIIKKTEADLKKIKHVAGL